MKTSNKASEILAKRRQENEINRNKRIDEVYEKIPTMASLEKNIKELGFTIINQTLSGGDTENLEVKLKKLRDLKEKLLLENGFSKDYMDLKYHHDLCKDTGFVGNDMCSCRKQIIIDENYNLSNIKNLIEKENFANFDDTLFDDNPYGNYPLTPRENIRIVKTNLMKYINNFSKESKNIYIFGDVGRGKTFLLNSVAKELLDRNFSVLYMTSSSLFKFLNDYNWAFEEQRYKHQEKYDFILDCDLLIIDDLGSEYPSKNNTSNLFDIVNTRMISQKPILFSTNYDESMLSETYGPRIFSRIVGNSEVHEIFGKDLRLRDM